jgi:hypothetical protein
MEERERLKQQAEIEAAALSGGIQNESRPDSNKNTNANKASDEELNRDLDDFGQQGPLLM